MLRRSGVFSRGPLVLDLTESGLVKPRGDGNRQGLNSDKPKRSQLGEGQALPIMSYERQAFRLRSRLSPE